MLAENLKKTVFFLLLINALLALGDYIHYTTKFKQAVVYVCRSGLEMAGASPSLLARGDE